MTATALIQEVARRMDEVTPDSSFAVSVDATDNNPLYDLIAGILEDGLLELYSVAPYWRLTQTEFDSSDINVAAISDSDTRKIIRIKLGDDFLRVAEIDCTDFQRPITEVFSEQSDEGRRQHNKYLRGKEAKPVGVLSHGEWTSGNATVLCREIDCYSLASDSGVEVSDVYATYIAKPSTPDPSASTAIDAPAVLLPALEWLIAARAFGARGDSAHASICQQNAQNLLM